MSSSRPTGIDLIFFWGVCMQLINRGFGPGHRVRSVLLGSAAIALAGLAAAATTTTTATTTSDKFPRLGMISTGGPQKYASAFQTYAAKFNVVIINGGYEGWQKGAGYSKEQVIQ